MKEPVDHILRPSLPWRLNSEGAITECGYDASKVKTLTRTEFFQTRKRPRQAANRHAHLHDVRRYGAQVGNVEDDPRLALQRELEWEFRYRRNDRGVRLRDELTAISGLVEKHKDEFLSLISEIENRRAWLEKKEALKDKPKGSNPRALAMTLRARLEESTQREIIAYIGAVAPRALVFACPNAAPRAFGGRASNGVPGLMKGAPDLIAVLPGSRVVFIEVKTAKGSSSIDQIAFSGRCKALGQPYFLVSV